MADQHQQQRVATEPEQNLVVNEARARRRAPPMPPDDLIRNTIARCLTQIVVNMRNPDIQQRCREHLQVEDLKQGAHIKILAALEHVDAQRERKTNERSSKNRK